MRYREIIERAEAAKDTEDPRLANTIALDLGFVAADAKQEAELLELGRKDVQLQTRDRFINERGMNKTNAEDESRRDPQYVEYCQRIEELREMAEKARALSRYFYVQAVTLVQQDGAHV